MEHYNALSPYLKNRFGCKICKLSLSAGCTCPNRDGRVGYGGCIYCSARGSGDSCRPASTPIGEQLDAQLAALSRKWQDPLGIAYFQAFTNTYAPLPVLR